MTHNNSGYNALCKSVEDQVNLAENIIMYEPGEGLKAGMDGYTVKFRVNGDGEYRPGDEVNYDWEVSKQDLGEIPEDEWWKGLEPKVEAEKKPVVAD